MTKIRCPKCKGSGQSNLPKLLEQTLASIQRRGSTPEELHAALVLKHGGSFGVTAVNGRLEQLRALGLVTREAEGRGVRYFRSKPKNTTA